MAEGTPPPKGPLSAAPPPPLPAAPARDAARHPPRESGTAPREPASTAPPGYVTEPAPGDWQKVIETVQWNTRMLSRKLSSETRVTLSFGQFLTLVTVIAGVILAGYSQVSTLRSEQVTAITALRADSVSKADFAELKGQIAALTTGVNNLTVQVATLTVRLEQTTKALEDLKAQRNKP